ncbi:MAG: DinB family protein [Candidatus Hydrogenedentota bacterium]
MSLLKPLMAFALVAGSSLPVFAADEAPSPTLSDEEHAELIQLLDESFELLEGLISGLSEEQWTFKQNESRWSVGECAEHIIRSEALLFENALMAMANDPDDDWAEKTKGKTDLIRQVMPNRQPMGRGGATAPFEIRPTEHWDRGKIFEEYYKIRGKVRAYVETLPRDKGVKNQIQTHPFPVFGDISAHDWIIYIPLHTIRHSRQMIEVMEDPNYPKK